MAEFEFANEYFLEIAQRCRYNDTLASFYEIMADMQYDKLYPLQERDLDLGIRHSIEHSAEYQKMQTYVNRAARMRCCMRTEWVSDYYRMSGIKVVKSVNRCRDRFCYNCQSVDALQRFYEYAPIIDGFSTDYDIYHCVFSQPNVPGFLLKQTMDLMQRSFSKWVGYMSGKKKIRGIDFQEEFGFVGAVRALEVSQNDKDKYYHPHFHCMVVLKKGIDVTPRHRNRFSYDYTHRREDRLFSDLEVLLQRMWYLLMNGLTVTKKNIENLPQYAGRQYPDGFSCYAENAKGHYHEIFKYCTKGSYKNGSILSDFDCARTLFDALYRRKVYQTYGCFYGIDMNEVHESLRSDNPADVCFEEILDRLNEFEVPETVHEHLNDILHLKIPTENKRGVRYLSSQSIRNAYANTPPEEQGRLKEKIISYIWDKL